MRSNSTALSAPYPHERIPLYHRPARHFFWRGRGSTTLTGSSHIAIGSAQCSSPPTASASTGTSRRIESLLGATLVAIFDATQAHVPQANVDAATQLAQAQRVDLLISLGGGSPIGVAKATAHALHSATSNPQSPISIPSHLLPILAIPTTYAGSEMTPLFGVTRQRDGITRKETVNDLRIVPRVVLYDPSLTLDLPRELTASTGINAFATVSKPPIPSRATPSPPRPPWRVRDRFMTR